MPDEHGSLFEELDPPGGGLEMLRARIERRASYERLGYASAIVLLLFLMAAIILGPRGLRPEQRLPAFDQARLRLGISSSPDEALTMPGARQVPLPTDEVLFYLVASAAPEPKDGK